MDKALQTMVDNMPEKTGKSLQEWKDLLSKKSFSKHGEAMKFLKEEHHVTHGFANTIIQLSKEEKEPEDLVTNQYKGKEGLFPIYEKLLAIATSLGEDVVVSPKKTSVSLVRKRQFALIKPANKTRIDLGLKFNEKPVAGRLENSGPFGTMCTHRIQLTELKQVDGELESWIKEAYEEAG